MVAKGRLQDAIESGRVAYGMGHFSGNPELVEIAGYVGFDFVYLDTHIAPLNLETIRSLIPSAYLAGISPLVRVTNHEPSEINRALNLRPEGIVVPHVDTPEQAEALVASARYEPRGTRGACPNVRASNYSTVPWVEYSTASNESTWIMPIVESRLGVESFDEIVSVDGIDVVLIGAHDLSVSLGVPGQDFRNPVMRTELEKMMAAAKARGVKTWTTTVLSFERDYVEFLESVGFDLISYNTDLGIFQRACSRLLKQKSL